LQRYDIVSLNGSNAREHDVVVDGDCIVTKV